MSTPSAAARARIGTSCTVEAKKGGRVLEAHSGEGKIVKVEATGTVIRRAGKSYPGVRYLVERSNGEKFWTVTMADDE